MSFMADTLVSAHARQVPALIKKFVPTAISHRASVPDSNPSENIVSVGGVGSGMIPLFTVTLTPLDVLVFPAASLAVAVMV